MLIIRSLRRFMADIIHHSPARVLVWILLALITGLTEGASFLLLIPLLALVGTSQNGGSDLELGENVGGLPNVALIISRELGVELSLVPVLLFYIVVVAGYAFIVWRQTIFTTRFCNSFIYTLSTKLFRSLCNADWLFVKQKRNSEMAQTFTTGLSMVTAATNRLLGSLGMIALMTVHLALAFLISPGLTGSSMVFLLCMFFFLLKYQHKAHTLGVQLVRNRKDAHASVDNLLNGLKMTMIIGAEDQVSHRFEKISATGQASILGNQRLQATTSLINTLAGTALMAGFVSAAIFVFHIPLMQLFLMIYIFARILPRGFRLYTQIQAVIHSVPAYQDIAVLQTELAKHRRPRSESQPVHFQTDIVFENVDFWYQQENIMTLLDVNLRISKGETVAITGPSGCGKSTLIDLIVGLLSPRRGNIYWNGKLISAVNQKIACQKVAYVPQDSFLFPGTIRENLIWGQIDKSDKQIWDALQIAAAAKFVEELPLGLDTPVGDSGTLFSGGERQRLCLARGLVSHPNLLILDEATSAVDIETEQRIMTSLSQSQNNYTIVVIAHRLETIKKATRIYHMNSGKIVKITDNISTNTMKRACQ